MSLSGQQRKELQLALIDAFPNAVSLEQMLAYELDKNLRAIAGEGSLQDAVFKLIQTANSQGWVEDLVRAACNSNPGNPRLRTIAGELLVNQDPETSSVSSPNICLEQTNSTPLQGELEQERKASLKPEPITRNLVFISYSHEDQQWLTKLQTHLKPMIRNQNLAVWDDTKIQPGAEWRKEIEEALATAKVAVLMVSPNFLASDFIADNELPPLLNAAQAKGLSIIWVPLSYSSYRETEIEKYQAAHPPKQPIDSLSLAEQNRALVDICNKIKAAAKL